MPRDQVIDETLGQRHPPEWIGMDAWNPGTRTSPGDGRTSTRVASGTRGRVATDGSSRARFPCVTSQAPSSAGTARRPTSRIKNARNTRCARAKAACAPCDRSSSTACRKRTLALRRSNVTLHEEIDTARANRAGASRVGGTIRQGVSREPRRHLHLAAIRTRASSRSTSGAKRCSGIARDEVIGRTIDELADLRAPEETESDFSELMRSRTGMCTSSSST